MKIVTFAFVVSAIVNFFTLLYIRITGTNSWIEQFGLFIAGFISTILLFVIMAITWIIIYYPVKKIKEYYQQLRYQ